MRAIFRREVYGYFTTPAAYVYLTAAAFLSGIYYFMLLIQGSAELGREFSFLFTVTLLLVPVLTMRLMSEERRQKTEQLLLSAPVSLTEIVLGKYLAAVFMFLLSLVFVFLQAASLSGYGPVNWALVWGNLLGLLLTGMACIAICMLISALTESQTAAAIGGFSAMLGILMINTVTNAVPWEVVKRILFRFSFFNSYYSLTVGLLQISDLCFFLIAASIFLFLTVQLLDYRRRNRRVYAAAFTAAVVIILLVLNTIAGELSTRYGLSLDLTENHMYRLSEETTGYLDHLEKEVEIHVLADESSLAGKSSYLAQIYQTLENYKNSRHISLDYINLVLKPSFAGRYPDYELKENDVIVECEGRVRILHLSDMLKTETSIDYASYTTARSISASAAEQQLTNAIAFVSAANPVTVSVLTGYSDASAEALMQLLSNNGFLVKEQSLIVEEIDPEASAAVIYGLRSDISEEILSKLDVWLDHEGEQGKTLLIFADPNAPELPNVNAFLREWGMALKREAAVETETSNYYFYPYYPAARYGDEDFAGALPESDNPVIMAFTSPLKILDTRADYVVTPLLKLSESAKTMGTDGTIHLAKDTIYTMLLSTHTNYGEKTNASYVVLSGSTQAFSSALLSESAFSNGEYLLGVVNKLTGRGEGLKIAAKDFTAARHSLNQRQVLRRAAIFLGVLPFGILGAGIFVWLKRRRK